MALAYRWDSAKHHTQVRPPMTVNGAIGAQAGLVRRYGAGLRGVLWAAALLMLAGCQTSGGGGTGFSLGTPQPQALGRDFGNAAGEKIKIALLLPLSSTDPGVRTIAQSLKQAAELALFDFNNPSIELVQKDTRGTAAGARFAADEALNEGAELILGPLRAQAASAAGQVASPRGVPVVSFSSTESIAGDGIYLLSFLPSVEVGRMVEYATARGLKRFAALVPSHAYGNVVAGDLTRITGELGATLFTVEKYDTQSGDVAGPVKKIAELSREFDALMIAEGEPGLGVIAREIGPGAPFQLLGTGLWNDPAIASEPALGGAWFPGPAPGTRQVFEQRFEQTYGRPPAAIASLGYDAVSLAAALARAPYGLRFTPEQLTDPNGFSGVDGLFRFRADGRIERSLAILQVTPQGFQVIDPARTSFAASNF